MNRETRRIVIVGGGAAGWLTAGVMAAGLGTGERDASITIELVESPDIATIGVGEGTWPSMRTTLQKIGIKEFDFIRECDVSFKQGSKFINWTSGQGESYYHPFSLPESYAETNLAYAWQQLKNKISFAHAVCPQSTLCDLQLAPKQKATPEYAFNANYGYHLNAGKFSDFVRQHCVENLGVIHRLDNISAVNADENGYIESLQGDKTGKISGDLFVDCTGFAALLIGKYYNIPFREKRGILFNDRAVALQVPYEDLNSPIGSCTLSTAQESGWIWDIGLSSRRGIGYTYASEFCTADEAEKTVRSYIAKTTQPKIAADLSIRQIKFNPGMREEFWHKNCVAIGGSAGFIEPLEASALVMIERAAQTLSEQFPSNRQVMNVVAKRFNTTMHYHWEKVIDFLKLHYVLSKRTDTEYWKAHTNSNSIPESLQESINLWTYQPPWKNDTYRIDELFPSASYQYVLFGMGHQTRYGFIDKAKEKSYMKHSAAIFEKCHGLINQYQHALPTNRELLNHIKQFSV